MKRPEPEERPYHHGNLGPALVEAALHLVEKSGPEGLSLRGIARAAGVSRGAPYHHFEDRGALLAAVAGEGFRMLREAMAEALESKSDAVSGFRAMGIAYVTFAFERPQLYRLMFAGELSDRAAHPDLREEADATFALLQRSAGAVPAASEPEGRRDRRPRSGEPPPVALSAWALVHGLAMLLVDRRIGSDTMTRADVESLVLDVTGVFGRGIRPRGD